MDCRFKTKEEFIKEYRGLDNVPGGFVDSMHKYVGQPYYEMDPDVDWESCDDYTWVGHLEDGDYTWNVSKSMITTDAADVSIHIDTDEVDVELDESLFEPITILV